MKYIFFTYSGEMNSIAEKLISEGKEVLIGVIPNKYDCLTKDELKEGKKLDNPDEKKKRMKMGRIKRMDAYELLKQMKTIKNKKDYFVMSETNGAFKFLTEAGKMGFIGHLATEEDRTLEVDRQKAKEDVAKFYDQILVQENHEFKTVEEGIAFLNENEGIFVLKSLGDTGETVVPKTDNPEVADQEIIDCLEKQKKDYEANSRVRTD